MNLYIKSSLTVVHHKNDGVTLMTLYQDFYNTGLIFSELCYKGLQFSITLYQVKR